METITTCNALPLSILSEARETDPPAPKFFRTGELVDIASLGQPTLIRHTTNLFSAHRNEVTASLVPGMHGWEVCEVMQMSDGGSGHIVLRFGPMHEQIWQRHVYATFIFSGNPALAA